MSRKSEINEKNVRSLVSGKLSIRSLQSKFRRSETKDYRKWAIEKFNQLIDDNKIDIMEIDIDELLGRGRR